MIKYFVVLLLTLSCISAGASFTLDSALYLRLGYSQHTLTNPGDRDSIYRGTAFGLEYGKSFFRTVNSHLLVSTGIDYSLLNNVEEQANQNETGKILSGRLDLSYKFTTLGFGVGAFYKYNKMTLDSTGVIDNSVNHSFYSYGLHADYILQSRFFNYGVRLSHEIGKIKTTETNLSEDLEYGNNSLFIFLSVLIP